MTSSFLNFFIKLDQLSVIMIMLVGFIALCVGSFASRYMKGDQQYRIFYMKLILLVIFVSLLVSADNLILFLLSWLFPICC